VVIDEKFCIIADKEPDFVPIGGDDGYCGGRGEAFFATI
jgi:hypothetical protein